MSDSDARWQPPRARVSGGAGPGRPRGHGLGPGAGDPRRPLLRGQGLCDASVPWAPWRRPRRPEWGGGAGGGRKHGRGPEGPVGPVGGAARPRGSPGRREGPAERKGRVSRRSGAARAGEGRAQRHCRGDRGWRLFRGDRGVPLRTRRRPKMDGSPLFGCWVSGWGEEPWDVLLAGTSEKPLRMDEGRKQHPEG